MTFRDHPGESGNGFMRWLRGVGRTGRATVANAPLMLLSLGLATVLWAFVTNQENPLERLPIASTFQLSSFGQAVDLPRSMVVTGYDPDSVSVTLVGSRQAVSKVQTADIQLQVDLNGAQIDTALTEVAVRAPVKGFVIGRSGVRVETSPTEVQVQLAPEERRTVPVKVSLTDAPPVGFELDSPPTSDPDQATISGVKQNVDAVDAVYADLKLTGLSVSTNLTLPLIPRTADGRTISDITVSPSSATVKVAIRRTIFTRDAFVSVTTDGQPAPGYRVQGVVSDPPTVTISGSLDQLNTVTTIPTDIVELEGATQDVKRVVNLRPPPGITIVNPRTITATVSVAAARGPVSLLIAPRVVGALPGETVQLSVPAITVAFEGPLPTILALKPGDVTATIDVTNLDPGVYSLDPKITLPAGLDKDSVTPAKIDVTITAAPVIATPAH
jgi:YbbR domain-containing protein